EVRATVFPRFKLSLLGRFEMTVLAGRSRPTAFLCLAAAFFASAATAAQIWPKAPVAHSRDAAVEARVRSIVSGMTLEQKIGQMTQADIRSITPEDVRRYYIGSILNGGG